MGRNRSAKATGPGTPMSRGEFLGAGAAAAAAGVSAACGGPPLVSPVPAPTATAQCTPPQCDPDGPSTWAISASMLQALWGEFFPRYVAWKWFKSLSTGSLVPVFGQGNVDAPTFVAAIDDYMGDPDGGLSLPPGSVFRTHVGDLRNYHLTSSAIPVRYLGEGGFDFILSDAGLDLFAPPRPESADELLRYCEFRDSGRATLGLPGYLDHPGALAFDVQAPGGPAQVWTQDLNVTVDAAGTCRLGALPCIRWSRDPERGAAVFTSQGFVAAASHVRCWQLEGSVYRGIIEQLPRIVATKWREELAGCTTSMTYASRWGDPHHFREIFKERLETSLDGPDRMLFRVGPAGGDVIVSNRGLTFPDCGSADPLLDLVRSIAQGRAGNPVFTDSKRPDRQG